MASWPWLTELQASATKLHGRVEAKGAILERRVLCCAVVLHMDNHATQYTVISDNIATSV